MQPTDPALRLYVAYDPYLTARQLALVVQAIDDIYLQLSYLDEFQRERMTFPDRARMRVSQAETGHSIELWLEAGQQVLADFLGAGNMIVGGAGVLAATTALTVGALRRVRVERQRAQLGAVTVASARTELALRQEGALIQLQRDRLDLMLRETAVEVARVDAVLGRRSPEQLAELATQLVRPVAALDRELNAANIVRASVNGEDVVAPPPGASAAE